MIEAASQLGIIPIPLKKGEPKRKRTQCIHVTKDGNHCTSKCWSSYIKTLQGPVFYGDQLCHAHSQVHKDRHREAMIRYTENTGLNEQKHSYIDHTGKVHVVKRAAYYRALRENKGTSVPMN